jgi:hypothetical protein
MNEADKTKAAAWIHTHITSVCPSCQAAGPFLILDELVAAPVLAGRNLTTRRFVPMIGLVCGKCGNVRFFSAVAAGLPSAPSHDPPTRPAGAGLSSTPPPPEPPTRPAGAGLVPPPDPPTRPSTGS